MSLATASILKDGTLAATGGTATAFTRISGDNVSALCVFDGTSILSRTEATMSRKSPKVNAGSPDGYTQARRTIVIKIPRTLASGALTYDTWRVESARSVETTAAQHTTAKGEVAQILFDTDFDEFWEEGSLD